MIGGICPTPEQQRGAVVEFAVSQLGEQDPDRYWREVQPRLTGQPHKISWCGAFALCCLRAAGLCDWEWTLYVSPTEPCGFLYRLRRTAKPLPGDVAYFNAGQHHAIVESVSFNHIRGITSCITIDGNSMRMPREGVTRTERHGDRAPAMPDAFYSIEPLLTINAQ